MSDCTTIKNLSDIKLNADCTMNHCKGVLMFPVVTSFLCALIHLRLPLRFVLHEFETCVAFLNQV